MFGFSLQKLIFTALVIVVVIYGFKAVARLQERRNAAGNGGAGGDAGSPAKTQNRPTKATSDPSAEDMVACRVCGTFVSASGTRSCGREDCPYPG